MRVRYSRRATRDLEAINEYLAQRSEQGVAHVIGAIYAAIEFARRNPEAGPTVNRISGVRGILVRRYRFKVFYRVLPGEGVVDIVHVRHMSRRPWQPK